ncbi:hypothetical protein ACNQS2_11430, partial [Corynebacterium diphtheriae]
QTATPPRDQAVTDATPTPHCAPTPRTKYRPAPLIISANGNSSTRSSRHRRHPHSALCTNPTHKVPSRAT